MREGRTKRWRGVKYDRGWEPRAAFGVDGPEASSDSQRQCALLWYWIRSKVQAPRYPLTPPLASATKRVPEYWPIT